MHGWDGKPLVSPSIHSARRAAHDAVDGVWKRAEEAYVFDEEPGTAAYQRAVKKVRGRARGRAYELLCAEFGLTAEEGHMAKLEDVDLLQRIAERFRQVTPESLREWAKARIT